MRIRAVCRGDGWLVCGPWRADAPPGGNPLVIADLQRLEEVAVERFYIELYFDFSAK